MAIFLRSRSSNRWADRSPIPAAQPAPAASALVTGFPASSENGGKVAVIPKRNFPGQAVPDTQGRRFPLGWVAFILMVIVPGVLAGVYYFVVAADQYVAEFRFALRTAEPVRNEASTILGNAVPSLVGVDSYAVVQYIGSRDIIDDVGKTVDLRAMFSRPEADWLVRLELPVTIEELVRYWKNQVDGFFDATNGTIVVRVRAFAPDDALILAQAVLASSERLVNDLSARARRDTLQNSEREVRRAERRLKSALAHLREFRDREGIIDPRKTADATQALAGRIRDEMVRAETELATVKHYMRGDAPSVKMLEARIQSLQTQLRSVESEVTDTERSRSEVLSRVMGTYERLESDRTFAERTYQHALEALDRSRINADRQQTYIAGFVQPNLPEEALYPRRLRAVGIVVFLCCAVWLIGALVLQTVREHL